MSSRRFDTIEVGSVIQYILLPSQQPTNPNRTWRGRVKKIISNASNEKAGMCCIISIEPGYENLEEYILFDQIVSIEE